jgi:hypothetical protein
MRYTILFASISLLIIGCTKNKFTTAPQLKYKSVNTTELHKGEIIVFKLSFTDGDGDLQDSIMVEKIEPTCTSSYFRQKYKLPLFPTTKDTEGEFEISFGYSVSNYPLLKAPQCNRNDTCYFRFMLKDKAQNTSDTVKSETIIIYK